MTATAGFGAVLLDPDVGDAELRARLLSTVPETQLSEDQSDLTNWSRGDRKARFEQTAERHAGLGQFAAPFLTRIVDEQGEGTSPTLSALRVYREHRAAGRRGLPPDAPLGFAPAALQPLIRHNGVTDRRRWESALFLKVRDEIQTGNLAIDGAKNFGRFEAFFLPSAQWEQVREAFWARTGFPVDPAAAVEQLKARLSDAFDRFLDGVPDNRQVTFDDDGWRLKTDPAKHPDPAQADSLVELHRWLDARSRSIRLADLLIEPPACRPSHTWPTENRRSIRVQVRRQMRTACLAPPLRNVFLAWSTKPASSAGWGATDSVPASMRPASSRSLIRPRM